MAGLMGAPLRTWIFRVLMALAVAATVAVIVRSPAPLWLRVTALASAAAAAMIVAFRFLPAFDPLQRILWRLPVSTHGSKQCAITFDDGPTPSTAAVLDVLAAEGVPATFFVLGAHVERHPDIVRRACDEGHAIGIHGMTHMRLAGASETAVEHQVTGVIRALSAAGVTPVPVYRTPHGFKSQAVFEVARRHGLALWAWSRGVWDTDRPAARVLIGRATRLARSGLVLLLHDGRGDELDPDVEPMVAALPAIIQDLKRRGFTFVRLA
jgi:peptidoglycan/xylan/chitin deacetylase (PgdA/CDA1 family)